MLRRLFTKFIAIGLVACASAKAVRPDAGLKSPRDLAIEVVRSGPTEEGYRSSLSILAQSMLQTMQKIEAAHGRKTPRELAQWIVDIVGEEVPYDLVTSVMVDFYVRHFTEDELRQLAELRRSAVFQKEVGLLPTMMLETSGQMQELFTARMPAIEAKLKARLAAQGQP